MILRFDPGRDYTGGYCAEQSVADTRSRGIKLFDQLFCFLSLGEAIGRTWVFKYRKVVQVPESYNIAFVDIEHGTD